MLFCHGRCNRLATGSIGTFLRHLFASPFPVSKRIKSSDICMVSTAAHLWLNMPKLRSGDRLDSRIYNIAHDWAASVAGSIFH